MSKYLLACLTAAVATSAFAQPAAYPDAPLSEIVEALQAGDAQYFADHIAYVQTPDLVKISPEELLLATDGCTLSDMQQGEFGMADIRLSCPGKADASVCQTDEVNLTVLSRRDGGFAIEIADVRSGEQECLRRPPPLRKEVSQ